MKTMKRFAGAKSVFLIVMVGVFLRAQSAPPAPDWLGVNIKVTLESVQAPAQSALPVLKRLAADPQRPNKLGFENTQEIDRATLGTPIVIFAVVTEKLKIFHAGSDTFGVLDQTPSSVIFPVYVHDQVRGDQVRSMIRLTRRTDGWHVAAFGESGLAKAIAQAIGQRCAQYFGVSVAAANLFYLGCTAQGFQLTATSDQYGFKSGETRPAAEVFLKLAPLAAVPARGPR